MTKELLFSVTAKDCDFDYIRGSGKGGQKRNKTSSAVRCRHLASGAIGYSEDTRSQQQNKITAFQRMAQSSTFQKWHKMEVARRMGVLKQAEEAAEAAMASQNLKVEGKQDGKWVDL